MLNSETLKDFRVLNYQKLRLLSDIKSVYRVMFELNMFQNSLFGHYLMSTINTQYGGH